MKKIIYIIGIMGVIFNFYNVSALEVTDAKSLKDCLKSSENICTVASNITLTSSLVAGEDLDVVVMGAKTLELNGNILADATYNVNHGLILISDNAGLTITGTGQIDTTKSSVEIVIEGQNNANLTMAGGEILGDYGIIFPNNYQGGNLTINGGTIIANKLGIIYSQNGNFNLNSGIVAGPSAIKVTSGNININGGRVVANANARDLDSNGNSVTASGVGILVSGENLLNVSVSDGRIIGVTPLYENTPSANAGNVSLNVAGGVFENVYAGQNSIWSNNFTKFITGGSYSYINSSAFLSYLADGTEFESNSVVYKFKVNITKEGMGEASANYERAIPGRDIIITVKPNKEYSLDNITIKDAMGNNITYNKEQEKVFFTMPNSEVFVQVKFIKNTLTINVPILNATNGIGVTSEADAKKVVKDSLTKAGYSADESSLIANLNADVISLDLANQTMLSKLQEFIKKDYKNASVFNLYKIGLNVEQDGKIDNIEIAGNIYFTTLIDKMPQLQEGYGRNYYVVRIITNADGSYSFSYVTDIKVTKDSKYLVYSTDETCFYAIAYMDEKGGMGNVGEIDKPVIDSPSQDKPNGNVPEEPNKDSDNIKIPNVSTHDDIAFYISLGYIALILIWCIFIMWVRKEKKQI